MAKVYAREKGHEYRVGNHGTAAHDRPALVPAAVAEELAADTRLRIEPDEPAAAEASRDARRKPIPETSAPEAGKE